jgi:hypothetical protein
VHRVDDRQRALGVSRAVDANDDGGIPFEGIVRRSMPGEGGSDGLALAALIAMRVSATTCPEGSDAIAFAIWGSSSSMDPPYWVRQEILLL